MYMYVSIACLCLFFICLILLARKNKQIISLKKQLQKNAASQEEIQSLPLPVFLKNKDGKITHQNRVFRIQFGEHKQATINLLSSLSNGEHSLEIPFDNGIKKNVSIFVKDTIGIIVDVDKERKKYEALLVKKEHTELALKGSNEGSWEWDIESDTINFSKTAYELLGYEEDETKPESLSDWLNIVSSYDLAQVNEAFAKHIQGESKNIFVQHRLKTAASDKWLLIKGKALKHKNTKIQKIYGTIADVSDIKAQTEELRKQRDLFRTFMDSLPALAFIKNKEGRYLYINPYYEGFLGFKEWQNKKVEEIYDEDLAKSIQESDREAFYEGIQKHEEVIPSESGQKYLFNTYKFPIDTLDAKVLCGFGLDVTKEKHYQERINLYANVFDHTTESIIITDKDANIIAVNKAFCQTTGFGEDELLGENPRIRKSGRHSQQFYENLFHELIENGSWRGEIFNKNKDGSILPELMNISSVKDKEGKILNFIGISQSIEKQKIMEESLRRKAHFDVLTNLPNRSLFFDRLKQALLRSQREKETLALVFMDLDDFKIINDTHGHKAGDIVLKKVAKRLSHCIRDTDTAGRLGGDEFVVVLESIRHLSDIDFIARKIIEEITKPIHIDDFLTCNIGVSLGISIAPMHTKDFKELLDFADKGMYMAKESGKNCYRLYKKD